MFNNFKIEFIEKENLKERIDTSLFLKNLGLNFDENIDITINLLSNNNVIATASAENNLIKCTAVYPDYQSEGLLNIIFSELIKYKFNLGVFDLSLFTKIENEEIISSLGFYTVCSTNSIVFMENSNNKFDKYLKSLPIAQEKKSVASIVMNLNPITNGHLYLIEHAANENDLLYVFILSDDKSIISSKKRFELALESTSHLTNVVLVKGGDYIISSSTFPSYFSKNYNIWLDNYCEIDLTIFSKYIAPRLNINKRYVGTEPYCELTNYYNKKMKEVLPFYNIETIEIERKSFETKAISSSYVRRLAYEGNYDYIKNIVPNATYKYLISNKWRQ